MDSLAMFFGAKKRKVTRKPRDYKDKGSVVVGGKTRKLYKGVNGGLYYKTKSGRNYVDSKYVRAHSPKRARRASPKRRRASPKRRARRASPKRRVRRSSPRRRVRRSSPKRRRVSPRRSRRTTRYGYGLGQPSLLDMMGPAGLSPVHYGGPPGGAVMPHHRKM